MNLCGKFFKNIREFGWYIFGGLLSVVMTVLLFMYPGSKKHLVIGIGLALFSGLLIVLKKFSWKVSLALLAVYLIIVPAKIYDRMELPIHDLTNVYPFAKVVTVCIFLLLYAFFFILTQRIPVAIAAGNVAVLLVTVIEFYVYKFRGSVIGPNDILAAKTAVMVMGNYDYTPTHELIYSVVWFVFFIVLACKINVTPGEIKKTFPGYPSVKVHLAASVLGVIAIVVAGIVLFKTDFLDKHGINSDNALSVLTSDSMGSILYPICEYNKLHMKMPAGYSAVKLAELGKKAESEFEPIHSEKAEVKPNIVLIMNESFTDLHILGDYDTDVPTLAFWNSLREKEEVVSGNLYVPVYGGLTVNSEFEVLTGNSLYFLSSSAIPYQTMFENRMLSLADEFKNLGYDTVAVHPNLKIAYDRINVYDKMGFDVFYGVEDFHVPLVTIGKEGDFVTDACNYDELIYLYENRDKSKPFFCFDVTIQNHGGYSGEYRKVKLASLGFSELEEDEVYADAEHYLSRVKESDEAFRELIGYFEKIDEPVIICMFGDHQPILSEAFYDRIFEGQDLSAEEKTRIKYVSQYVIWSNFDADFEDVGDFSANYLGAVLMDEAGLDLSEFRMFQREAMKELPILSSNNLIDASGKKVRESEADNLKAVSEYKFFEYWKLYDGSAEAEPVFLPKQD